MAIEAIRKQVLRANRRLLSEQNRDSYSPSFGCFDRRFWGWKVADFPDATLQRNVYSLAWLLKNPEPQSGLNVEMLRDSVQAGLWYATEIQHPDGSFDQAFPHERSFGATGFLFTPLIEAYRIIEKSGTQEFRDRIEKCLRRAADFLCQNEECHGFISNHLAGAGLSMLRAWEYFGQENYRKKAESLLNAVLEHQSPEGWFWEYDGADPGYQTLCLYYLARIHKKRTDPALRAALERGIEFLIWFAHPDGSFGGEYGSRRTAIFYPGGLSLLENEFPYARRLLRHMVQSIGRGLTTSLDDIDMGNTAPLLENYLTLLEEGSQKSVDPQGPLLPFELDQSSRDFPEAGLSARGRQRYYAILGASNGGVLKVFDRKERKKIWDDGGYVGLTTAGEYVTSQMTDLQRSITYSPETIHLETPFYLMLRSGPSPLKFIILRLLNLTVMRRKSVGNWIKRWMVKTLISRRNPLPLRLQRTVVFSSDTVTVSDRLDGSLHLRWLEYGHPFVAIHMASARYFGGNGGSSSPRRVDVSNLNATGKSEHQERI